MNDCGNCKKKDTGKTSFDKLLLLADDDVANREALAKFLDIKGFKVISAENGLEALELFEAHADQINICLIDLYMPELDGQSCIEGIRKFDKDVPIYLLTGETDQSSLQTDLSNQINGYFTKPFDWDELIEELKKTSY